MTERFLIRLFINAATRHNAESQLEHVLSGLPKEYAHYVHDISIGPNDKLAALDDVTVTPTVVLEDIAGASRRLLEGACDDEQLRHFLLGN